MQVYEQARDDSGLIELRDEIALLRARITDLLGSDQDATDGEAWSQVIDTADVVRKLVSEERKRIEAGQQMMSAERVMATLNVILEVLREHVAPPVLALVSQEIARRTSLPHTVASTSRRSMI